MVNNSATAFRRRDADECDRAGRAPRFLGQGLGWLSEQVFHHFAGDVRQAEIAALKTVGEPLVVQAEQVEDRRVEIIHVDRVGDDVQTVNANG